MANEALARPAHRGLRILLDVVGVLCLLGVLSAFLPTAWLKAMMNWWARLIGEGELAPFSPMFWYGFRAIYLVFLGVAWMCFAAARDPERHRDFIHAVMLTLAAWVILCPVFGHGAGLPFLWYMGDSISSLILLVLFFVLYPRGPAVAA